MIWVYKTKSIIPEQSNKKQRIVESMQIKNCDGLVGEYFLV